MRFSFLIVDHNAAKIDQTLKLFENFPNYFCVGTFKSDEITIDQIFKLKPKLVIIGIPFASKDTGISFAALSEMHQYMDNMPYFVALSDDKLLAFDAIQAGFCDFALRPFQLHQLGKSLFKFEKKSNNNVIDNICIKSYSDYQFVALADVIYLKADNNTTDIKLINGKTVNAYKTLKHFENSLPFYFMRIHKSYIVNINHVSRIHFSKLKCYLNYNEILPFSISYRENIDLIVRNINF